MQLLMVLIFLFCGLKAAQITVSSLSQQRQSSEVDSVTNAQVILAGNVTDESLDSFLLWSHGTLEVPKRTSNQKTNNKGTKTGKSRSRARNNLEKRKLSRVLRAATALTERVWADGVIPYVFDESFRGNAALVKQAMRQWENLTCIKFVERERDVHPDYILITEKNCGCCSLFVGRKGTGSQEISISSRCQIGNILHELGHAIGFWHEHSRPDRDEHVKILSNNIISGLEGNFKRLNQTEVNTWSSPYDFASIMHYGRRGFSRGQYLETIIPIVPEGGKDFDIGQREQLSENDIKQTNRLYNCLKCGQTFQNHSGTFSFVSSYNVSENEDNCQWFIAATSGEKIILNITNFDIEESTNCSTSYLEVRDGYWYKSPLLAKICGSGKFQSIVSTGSSMLITYVSKSVKLPQTLVAEYQTICGGDIFLDEETYIDSPNYPEDYRPNTDCIWRIVVPETFQVALRFQFFEVEKQEHCLYDYVEIREGFSDNSTVLGLFCGSTLPPDLISSSNQLFLRFVSDSSRQREGFSVTVIKEFDECAKTDHGCDQKCVNTLGSYECVCDKGFELQEDRKQCEVTCGGSLETSNGTIMSPSFPNSYPLNQTCIWEIVAKPQHRIVLNFTHFDLEGNNENYMYQQVCDYDKVEIQGQTIEQKKVFCGSNLPSPILSEGNVMTLKFTSDDTFTKTGFSASFSTERDECEDDNGGCEYRCVKTIGSYYCICPYGFTLHTNGRNCLRGDCYHEVKDPFGAIQTPNYPNVYPKVKNCVWKFQTTPGHRIRIAFLFFELESHQECLYDYVELHNGPSLESSTMGTFCGSDLPPVMVSSSNELYINFKSNAAIQGRGLWATYSSVCGGMLLATSDKKHIFSHSTFGVEDYYIKASCEWTIATSFDFGIKLTFLSFNLEDDMDCLLDFVEIFGGLESNEFYYGRFCGSNKPPDIISSQNGLRLRFQSDESFQAEGFQIEYIAVDDFL